MAVDKIQGGVMARKSINVMAKYLSMFLPDNKAVQIDVCDLVSGTVEGTFDGGESTFSFKATRTQIYELMECVDKVKVITPDDKKNEEKESVFIAKEVKEPIEAVKVESSFTPPAERVAVTRQKFSSKDPREQTLMSRFVLSYPNPYKGRKKLSDDEKVYIGTREDAIEIAKSYILSGDRTTVEKWIEHNSKQFGGK